MTGIFIRNLDTFDEKLATAFDLQARAATLGTVRFERRARVELMRAIETDRDCRFATETERGIFGERAFAQHIEIKLHGIIHDRGQFANDEMDRSDTVRAIPLRCLDGCFENTFRDGELMHCKSIVPDLPQISKIAFDNRASRCRITVR
jgi:hypothetical protein